MWPQYTNSASILNVDYCRGSGISVFHTELWPWNPKLCHFIGHPIAMSFHVLSFWGHSFFSYAPKKDRRNRTSYPHRGNSRGTMRPNGIINIANNCSYKEMSMVMHIYFLSCAWYSDYHTLFSHVKDRLPNLSLSEPILAYGPLTKYFGSSFAGPNVANSKDRLL